ncbi:site-specific DNA-methyltransferase [Pseudomonas parafulva]|uniref:DNA-methyltransferase n=1 Tax=Pseudomonas parafulva TaxID=157782 RepID=UPI0018D6ABF1|nr:site-specific DNA-methyltransferase [Pseudomonas parafulva]MBH3346071.1 site-specific DNA-methyltransferase [Pseudomonas parafulva]
MLDRIVNGDCLDLLRSLPDESVDLVVSSPPYNIGKEYEARRELEHYLQEQREVLTECHRVLKPSGSIFWQVGSYSNKGTLVPLDIKFFPILEELGMFPRNRIIWVRQHGLHATKKFSGRHESILWFSKSDNFLFDLNAVRVPQKWQNKKSHRGDNKGELSCNPEGKNPGDVWVFQNVKHNHEEQTIHPAQFPEGLIARIVLATTPKGGVVFDPYMGTGTTAVVARDHERHFIGAEIDKGYHKVAMRRLSGLPDSQGSFPNLKTLRAYVARTGESIEKFRFDVQVGKVASDGSKAKIYPEEYHAEQLTERLQYEADAFEAKIAGKPIPVAKDLNGKSAKKISTLTPLASMPLFEE